MSEAATRCCVLHPDLRQLTRRQPEHALAEAVSLAMALSLDVVHEAVVPVPAPKAGTLFGPGKLEELKTLLSDAEVSLVIIDGPVTPVQQRNLEKAWKVKILDRTGLILEIFGDRAQTREGVLQVELAALSYQKTRLVRSWTHLERQRGGLGFVGGPGETQIEADRRAINDQIVRIRRALTKVVKTRGLHRAARKKVPYPIVAFVGYTNAGKSTLFNRMTGADVFAKDMLFATLDPTMRAVELPSGMKVILSDTVGFISDLPTQLVAAFRATLEEVLDADLIVHVRDIAHPESEAQAADVRAILEELGIDETQQQHMIEVWNKMDLKSGAEADALRAAAERHSHIVPISAVTGQGIDPFLQTVSDALTPPTTDETRILPFSQGQALSWLQARKIVQDMETKDGGYRVTLRWNAKQKSQYAKQFESE